MTAADIEIHERLTKLEIVVKNQNEGIASLIKVIEKHCDSDELATTALSKRISQLENLSFGGKVLFKFVLGCIMIGGTIFGFTKWFHDIALGGGR